MGLCGGWAELRAPFVRPRVAVGSAAGDLPAVAVPQALRSLCRGSHTRPHSPDPQCSPSLRPRAGPTLECGSR